MELGIPPATAHVTDANVNSLKAHTCIYHWYKKILQKYI